MLKEKAIKYANDVVNGEEVATKEVIKQCEWFLNDLKRQDDNNFKYYFDEKEIEKIEGILKLLNFATGLGVVGLPILEGLWGFQAFFLCNVFGWRFKEDKKKFKNRTNILFIPRKNAKTFICALIIIILMLIEDHYSEFYSICLDRELASKVKEAMTQIINASPDILKHFITSKTLNGKITCKITNSFYQARTAEANKNNSIRPSAFIADEIGAFRDSKNINAMKSGQLSVKNPLRFKITTAYAESESIMIEELDYIRKVYDGVIDDDRIFSLLYYAEKSHEWDDIGLEMANPLRVKENYQEIKDNRKVAKEKLSEQTEFLTKHMNVFVTNDKSERYIDMDDWKKCQVETIDLEGKQVVVSIDASLTTDLTAINIMYKEKGIYYLKSHAFLPRLSLSERREKIDYNLMEKLGYCTIVEGKYVDYNLLEDYIRNIESKYNCTIKKICSDPFNFIQNLQNLANDYDVDIIKQTYSELSAPTKTFRNDVYGEKVKYEKNKLLDWNMSNAKAKPKKVTGDILLEKVNKNKTRIDMVVATIFAYSKLYLEEDDTYDYEITDEKLDEWGW
ncbi:terminase large subunit [Clostridium sp. D2Q-11]|uniref:Terminase large subunit n=1 Tax=Anaeromonas frigoriresistens TaxID=2683708 RepID=A0A942UZE5_9FIRM|nr:terminase TerL endonuclease subunit [Anaeromonas frigoriresistens]MBS4539816.1 terminase large subunit [Anaeromonas frigoriresistens]